MPEQGLVSSLIDTAARAMCCADDQRHLRLERRDGAPCRLHENAAYVAVEALLPMIESARTTSSPESTKGSYQPPTEGQT